MCSITPTLNANSGPNTLVAYYNYAVLRDVNTSKTSLRGLLSEVNNVREYFKTQFHTYGECKNPDRSIYKHQICTTVNYRLRESTFYLTKQLAKRAQEHLKNYKKSWHVIEIKVGTAHLQKINGVWTVPE
jgi:stress response protein YsnF